VAVLASTWLFHLALNTLYLVADRGCPKSVDSTSHLNTIYQIVSGITLSRWDAVWQEIASLDLRYPMLVYLFHSLLGSLVDPSMFSLRLYNIVFTAALLVGMYWLGSACHGRLAGLLAAICCSCVPNIFGHSRQFGLDFPCAAMVALAMAAMVANRQFASKKMTVALGVLGGLAVLTKGQALLFLAPPALAALVVIARARDKRALKYFALAAVLVLGISATWWFSQVRDVANIFLQHFDSTNLEREGNQTLWGGVRMYLLGFPKLVSLPLFVGFVTLGVKGVLRMKGTRWLILLWLLVPLALHVLLAVRNYRYLLPLVPAVALLVAVGAASFRAAWARRIACGLLVTSSLGTALACTVPALRHPAWSCTAELCGELMLGVVNRGGALREAARRIGLTLDAERSKGRTVVLVAAQAADANANGDLVDLSNFLRSGHPHVVFLFEDELPYKTWRYRGISGPVAHYIVSEGTRPPREMVGQNVLAVSLTDIQSTPGLQMGERGDDCTTAFAFPTVLPMVTLWKVDEGFPR